MTSNQLKQAIDSARALLDLLLKMEREHAAATPGLPTQTLPTAPPYTTTSLLERCLELAKQNQQDCPCNANQRLVEDLEAAIAEQVKPQEPVEHQYKSNSDGNWYRFDSEKHYQNTKSDGQWEIRALYTHPQAHHNIGVKK